MDEVSLGLLLFAVCFGFGVLIGAVIACLNWLNTP